MIGRALIVWCGLLVCANANGLFREAVLSPRLGAGIAHVGSTLLLSGLVLVLAVATIDWMGPRSRADALAIGLVWLLLVLAFEFLAGHFLFGQTWEKLFADYNIFEGRIWPLVLLATFLAPLAGFIGRK